MTTATKLTKEGALELGLSEMKAATITEEEIEARRAGIARIEEQLELIREFVSEGDELERQAFDDLGRSFVLRFKTGVILLDMKAFWGQGIWGPKLKNYSERLDRDEDTLRGWMEFAKWARKKWGTVEDAENHLQEIAAQNRPSFESMKEWLKECAKGTNSPPPVGRKRGRKSGKTGGKKGADESNKIRKVQLSLDNKEVFEPFVGCCQWLGKEFGTSNMSDTVLRAVAEAMEVRKGPNEYSNTIKNWFVRQQEQAKRKPAVDESAFVGKEQ